MTREDLQKQIDEFLAAGNKIEKLPYRGDTVIRPKPEANIREGGKYV